MGKKLRSEDAAPAYMATDDDTAIIADALARIDRRFARGETLDDPHRAGEYIKLRLGQLEHEVFLCMFLNSCHRVLAVEELFRGSLSGAEVHPREVVKAALRRNASAVIFGHNHPSGNSEPSAADRTVTTRLREALQLVDIRVLDHFVVGHGEPTSMANRGWL